MENNTGPVSHSARMRNLYFAGLPKSNDTPPQSGHQTQGQAPAAACNPNPANPPSRQLINLAYMTAAEDIAHAKATWAAGRAARTQAHSFAHTQAHSFAMGHAKTKAMEAARLYGQEFNGGAFSYTFQHEHGVAYARKYAELYNILFKISFEEGYRVVSATAFVEAYEQLARGVPLRDVMGGVGGEVGVGGNAR